MTCISKIIIIGSDNGLPPGQRQAIIWTNAGILLIWPLGINFNEINFNRNQYIFIQENAFENVVCCVASISSWPQCVKDHIVSFMRLSLPHNCQPGGISSVTLLPNEWITVKNNITLLQCGPDATHQFPPKLTHWGRDKMAAIFQMRLWNVFSLIKMYNFLLRFHWSLFLRVQLTIFQHWFR